MLAAFLIVALASFLSPLPRPASTAVPRVLVRTVPSGSTLITISGNTPPDEALPSTCVGIEICITLDWCSGTEFCQTCDVCITVEAGDTRKSLTSDLAALLEECLPNANILPGDVTINVGGTPPGTGNNTGTPEMPTKYPPDGNDSRVYSSRYTE
jgi:hypothetical protein